MANRLSEFIAGLPGTVLATARTAAPDGWLLCDGAAVSRVDYAALFNAIGETYGAGDGSTTFNLPELRGEAIRGLDNGRGVDVGRTLGSAQADAFQGHKMGAKLLTDYAPDTGGSPLGALRPRTDSQGTNSEAIGDFYDDGINGEPRIASETRMRNIALNYIIKT